MKCCVPMCRNCSERQGETAEKLSFHVFPSDDDLKQRWIKAVNREAGWVPTKYTKICSLHFEDKHFYFTRKGLKKIRQGAYPTLKVETCQRKESDVENVNEQQGDNEFLRLNDTPRKIMLKQEIYRLRRKEKKLTLKVRKLQMTSNRLKKKVSNMESLIKTLKKKNFVSGEEADVLSAMDAKTKDLVHRQISKIKKLPLKRKYSPALRSFALTLHYYSPRAYVYVRRTFDTCLPHPRTLTKWYENVNGEPGFTSESFKVLKLKSEISQKRLRCCLVMDEMAIKKHVEWDGSRYHGYVDVGTNSFESDTEAKASEALVLLLVCIEERWKLPIAFFLLNSITGKQRATLIKQCLMKCDDVGVDIVSLTNDGCPSNITMAKILGCNFDIDRLKTTFPHPTANYEVAYFLDACHMLKLIRNAFEKKKTLIDYQGNKIKWEYVAELNNLQNKEGFHIANKLKNTHVHFERQKMKVKLASQLFSYGVADALQLCQQNNDPKFKEAGATVEFIRLINNIFDVLNSRSMKQFEYKKPLFSGNIEKAKDIFEFAEKYIMYLTDSQENKPILNTNRKTGFLGFIVCIRSALYLYKRLVEDEKVLRFLPLHKASQDHLELFFCLIRAHGRTCNNPTVRQFKAAYKKTLVKTELKDAFGGNCIPQEDISILSTSAIDKINNTAQRHRMQQELNQSLEEPIPDDVLLEFDSLLEQTMCNNLRRQIITYIAGYVVKYLSTRLTCENCLSSLYAQDYNDDHKLIRIKSKGGLCYASKDVVDICVRAECSIRSLKTESLNNPIFRKDKIVLHTLKSLVGVNIFCAEHEHMFEQAPFDNHIILLCKCIVERYVNTRLRYFSICENIRETKRQQLNKIVLFMGD